MNTLLTPTTTFVPSSNNQVSEFVYQMPIEGLLYVKHKRFDDDRGFYAELNRVPEIEAIIGKPFCTKQLNLSHSKQHVTRGFHAENWNKLLSVTHGSCFCAWADIRPSSETFGKVVTMTIGVDEPTYGSVFVSAGLANSFCVLTETADYVYSVDALYQDRDTSGDVALSLFDPELAVAWPVDPSQMIISQRDREAKTLQQLFPDRKK